MKRIPFPISQLIIVFFVLILSNCGEGGIDGTGILKGTAVDGAPLKNTKILVTGRGGKTAEAITNDKGKFEVKVAALSAPYLLKANTNTGDELFSIALNDGTINIHALTDVVSRKYFAGENQDIAVGFNADGFAETINSEIQKDVADIAKSFEDLLETAFDDFQIPDNFDFFVSDFDANDKLFDALLDQLKVKIENGEINLILIDQSTNFTANIIVNLNITTDLSQEDSEPPTVPKKVKPAAAGNTIILVGWESSTDNIGVAGYRVYRSDSIAADRTMALVDTVAVPVYVDTNVEASKNYCYEIEAFDVRENTSPKSEILCTETPSAPDTEPPKKIDTFEVIIKSESSIELKWAPGEEEDILGYHVYRGVGASPLKIATVVTSTFLDTGLQPNTNYCYRLVVFDAALNQLPLSESPSCVSTKKPAGKTDSAVFTLSINSNNPNGTISSDLDGINCGDVCSAVYPNDSQLKLTASHPSSMATVWTGCDATTENQCTVTITADTQVDVNFVPVTQIEKIPPITDALPTGGEFETATKVNLVCSDSGGSGCKQSYYTVDGQTPTTSSTQYSTSIEINENSTLKFFSIDNNDNAEKVRTEVYKIALATDNSPPTTTATPKGGSYDAVQVIELSCSDTGPAGCDKIYYTLDGIDPTTDSLEYKSALTLIKSRTIKFFAVDKRGNKEIFQTQIYTIVINTDFTPPATIASETSGSFTEIFSVSLLCSDGESIACKNTFYTTDGSEPTLGINPYINAIPIKKNTTLKYFSIDVAGNKEAIKTEIYTIKVPVDIGPLATIATPKGGYYNTSTNVILSCNDIDGVGCGKTYFTNDGTEPTINSSEYNTGVLVEKDTILKYFTVDGAGNPEATKSSVYFITTSPLFTLTIVPSDAFSQITSDIQGIDCGSNCSANYPLNTPITLTAFHPVAQRYAWTGCTIISNSECSIKIQGDTTVNVDFIPFFKEIERNNTFDEADTLAGLVSVDAFFNSADDEDYYKFTINDPGVLYAYISHPLVSSYLYLYNADKQIIRSSGFELAHTLSMSIQPGTYFLRVIPNDGQFDLVNSYQLELSGSALGGNTLDGFENNDTLTTAYEVVAAGRYEGYFDTQNDLDYFSFTVGPDSAGTFQAKLSHSTINSNLQLYDAENAELARSIRGTTHSISKSLLPGTYYLLVSAYANEFDQLNAYTLDLTGTVLNGKSPDKHEYNDTEATASKITSGGEILGYFDTQNDFDYYEIVVLTSGTLYIENSHKTIKSSLYLSRQGVTSGSNILNPKISWSVSPGSYLIRVRPDDDFDLETAYKLKLSGSIFDDPIVDNNEPNDMIDKAKLIVGSGEYSGYFDTSNDVDYFSFRVDSAGTFFAILSHESINGLIQLFNSENTRLTRTNAPFTLTQTLQPGSYFLSVSAPQYDITVPYKLLLAGTAIGSETPGINEPDDAINTATPIITEGIIKARLETENDFDYYQFTAVTNGIFYANYSHPKLLAILELINENEEIVTTAQPGREISWSVNPGDYYLVVKNYSVSSNSRVELYTLNLTGTVLDGLSLDTFEENDTFSSAKLVEANGDYVGLMDTINDQDYYQFTLDTAAELSINLTYNTNISWYLYDDLENELATEMIPTNNTPNFPLSAGTYYIAVKTDLSRYSKTTTYNLNLLTK